MIEMHPRMSEIERRKPDERRSRQTELGEKPRWRMRGEGRVCFVWVRNRCNRLLVKKFFLIFYFNKLKFFKSSVVRYNTLSYSYRSMTQKKKVKRKQKKVKILGKKMVLHLNLEVFDYESRCVSSKLSSFFFLIRGKPSELSIVQTWSIS